MTPGDLLSVIVHVAGLGTIGLLVRDLLKVNERVEALEQGNEREDKREHELADECRQLRAQLDEAMTTVKWLANKERARDIEATDWDDDNDATRARPSLEPLEPDATLIRSPSAPPLPSFTYHSAGCFCDSCVIGGLRRQE